MGFLMYNGYQTRRKLFRQQWVSTLLNRGIYDPETIRNYLATNLGMKEVTLQTIYNDFKDLEEKAEKILVDELTEARIKLLDQHQYLYQEALRAWDESKQEQITETVEETPQGEKHKIVKTRTPGSVSYLSTAQAQLDRMAKLLGVDAPTKLDIEQNLPEGVSLDQALKTLAEIITPQNENPNKDWLVEDDSF